MKKNIIIFSIITFLYSCESNQVEVEVNANAGKHYLANFKDKKYIFGSDEDARNAVKLVMAYADKDVETMSKFMGDTVVYFPPNGGMSMNTAKSELPNIVEMLHQPYDSIKRTLYSVIPLKPQGADFTRAEVNFKEDRYLKDGTQQSVMLHDKIFFRNGEIFRIVQLMGERPTPQ
tara:strand:- start:212 stop:736 length:525 start_codon:yes stop_codon:yes gene_type:complete